MGSRTYKIINIIWLAFLFVGTSFFLVYCSFFSENKAWLRLLLYVFPLIVGFGIGVAGLKLPKTKKTSYLPSLISGVVAFVIYLIYLIKNNPFNYTGGILFFGFFLLVVVTQIITNVIALLLYKSHTDTSEETGSAVAIAEIIRNIFKETFYYFGFYLIAALSACFVFAFSYNLFDYSYLLRTSNDNSLYITYLVLYVSLSLVSLTSFVTTICSYVSFVKEHQHKKKKGFVFTIIALSAFYAIFVVKYLDILWSIAIIGLLVVGSTLISKEESEFGLKRLPRVFVILTAISILSIFITFEVYTFNYNLANSPGYLGSSIYHFSPYFGSRGSRSGYPGRIWDYRIVYIYQYSPYILLPLIVAITMIFKKNIDKRFLKSFLLISGISSIVIILLLPLTFLSNFVNNIQYAKYASLDQRILNSIIFEFIKKILAFCLPFLLTSVFSFVSLGLVKHQKQIENDELALQEQEVDQDFMLEENGNVLEEAYVNEQTLENIEENLIQDDTPQTKEEKLSLFNIIGRVLIPVVGLLAFFFIPVIYDKFDNRLSFSQLFSDQSNIQITDLLIEQILVFLVSTCFAMQFFFVFFVFGFYKEKAKLVKKIEFAMCIVQIAMYAFLVGLVIFSNVAFKTAFGTLAFIPVIVFALWIVALIIYENLSKIKTAMQKHREKASIRKAERAAIKAEIAQRKREEKEQRRVQREEERRQREEQARLLEEKERAEEEEALRLEQEAAILESEKLFAQNSQTTKLSSGDKIRQLQDLVKLKEAGAITDAEFLELKEEILRGEQ